MRLSSLLLLPLLNLARAAPNPNCMSRGKCIAVGPGTKYPEQNTLCLVDAGKTGHWHCANTAGQWGAADHSFGPGSAFDLTMLGGSPVHPQPPGTPDLKESFNVHATNITNYDKCDPSGALQWKITRELRFLNGTSDGLCQTKIFEGTRMLGDFLHNCSVLTQITVAADTNGAAQCVGCRCCTTCSPPELCLPP